MLNKISSTGYKGASQGALSSAFLNDLDITGYCPNQYILPTGAQPQLSALGLLQHNSSELEECIIDNIMSADGVLQFYTDELDDLQTKVKTLVEKFDKSYMDIDINNPSDVRIVQLFLETRNIEILHIDGSFDDDVSNDNFEFVKDYIDRLIHNIRQDKLYKH